MVISTSSISAGTLALGSPNTFTPAISLTANTNDGRGYSTSANLTDGHSNDPGLWNSGDNLNIPATSFTLTGNGNPVAGNANFVGVDTSTGAVSNQARSDTLSVTPSGTTAPATYDLGVLTYTITPS